MERWKLGAEVLKSLIFPHSGHSWDNSEWDRDRKHAFSMISDICSQISWTARLIGFATARRDDGETMDP